MGTIAAIIVSMFIGSTTTLIIMSAVIAGKRRDEDARVFGHMHRRSIRAGRVGHYEEPCDCCGNHGECDCL